MRPLSNLLQTFQPHENLCWILQLNSFISSWTWTSLPLITSINHNSARQTCEKRILHNHLLHSWPVLIEINYSCKDLKWAQLDEKDFWTYFLHVTRRRRGSGEDLHWTIDFSQRRTLLRSQLHPDSKHSARINFSLKITEKKSRKIFNMLATFIYIALQLSSSCDPLCYAWALNSERGFLTMCLWFSVPFS